MRNAWGGGGGAALFPDQNVRLHEASCFLGRLGEASVRPQTTQLPEAAPRPGV